MILPPDEKVECVDTNIHCAWWAGQGECERNAAYMSSSCPRSCDACGENFPVPFKIYLLFVTVAVFRLYNAYRQLSMHGVIAILFLCLATNFR